MHAAIENKIVNSSKPFDWDSILDMKVPPSPCPEGVNSLVKRFHACLFFKECVLDLYCNKRNVCIVFDRFLLRTEVF